ncbi:syntabulin-like [Opisthocomus hoazin]|uniref:syntabulin-like n=1 Tax=Opisthocomus hoazin TaxID=30419 RepID=UPI003F53055B
MLLPSRVRKVSFLHKGRAYDKLQPYLAHFVRVPKQGVQHSLDGMICVLLKEPRTEADLSSSSSTGSISAPEARVTAAGSQRSSFSRNRGPYGQNNGSLSCKSAASPPASRQKEPLSALCKNQLTPANIRQNYRASSGTSSSSGSYKGSDSSPALRCSGGCHACGAHYKIKPPNPEQDLTALQQKEATLRHLKTKLKESESKLKEREIEIAELKAQLGRMKEDWIEEECKHVEGDLALNEARSKIKQLEQVIEAMKNNAVEKDQKIQKYFLDISIENKKLESLLQSMEMAQNSSAMDEQCLQYSCDAEGKPSALCATMPESLMAEDQALEEVADSRLLLSEDTSNGTDSAEESWSSTACEWSDPAPSSCVVKKLMLDSVADEKLTSSRQEEKSSSVMVEQAVQTDTVPYSLDVEQLIQNVFRAQDACSPVQSLCRKVEHRVGENHFMKELDFTDPHDDEAFGYVNTCSQAGRKRRYWSSSLLRDVPAVAAPVVSTVMWAFSTQRGGLDYIYNIGALLRGCCLVALHSLRHTLFSVKT